MNISAKCITRVRWPMRMRRVSTGKLVGIALGFLVFFVRPAPVELVSAGLLESTQINHGTIEGRVVDSSGAPVADATKI